MTLPPIDRWHSRPLDVHRWSDHPEIHKLVKKIYGELSKETISQIESKSNNKAKASGEVHLRLLILDLFVAWKEDPTLAIGVHMGNWAYKVNSRYNALHISPKIRPLVHALRELTYVDFKAHSQNSANPIANSTSRIRASTKLGDLFKSTNLSVYDINLSHKRECIVLTKVDISADGNALTRTGNKSKKKPTAIEYEDTPTTLEMRSNLTAYNRQLEKTFIDIPSLEESIITRIVDGKEQRIRIDQSGKFVKRIFSRGSWTNNGRFYGGWWQQIPSSYRENIYINNRQTIEIDYSGLHIAILSAQKNKKIKGDKYDLGGLLIDGVDAQTQRKCVKRLALTAINSRSEKAAFQAFRSNADDGSLEKRLKNNQLKALLNAFKDLHPHLKGDLCSDKGIELMYLDSQITDKIIQHFLKSNKTVLTVHDSYIVDCADTIELRNAMKQASIDVVGQDLEAEMEGTIFPSADLYGANDAAIYEEIGRNLNLSSQCLDAYKARHHEFIRNNS